VRVIPPSKSYEFLLKVRLLFSFFSTTTPTPSRRRVVFFPRRRKGFDFDDESMFFPRRRTLVYRHRDVELVQRRPANVVVERKY